MHANWTVTPFLLAITDLISQKEMTRIILGGILKVLTHPAVLAMFALAFICGVIIRSLERATERKRQERERKQKREDIEDAIGNALQKHNNKK